MQEGAKLRAVVMAGGEGSRLRPITERQPKPFVRVAGRPVIEYVLERLREAGVEEVIVTTCYKPLPLVERLEGGAALGLRLFYSVEDEPMGTAGGVARCASLLSGTFLVASGDVLADVDVGKLVQLHRDRKALATMALTEVEDPSEFGVVDVAPDGKVRRFQEKPKREEAFSNLVNAGIYVVEPEALAMIPPGRKYDFSKDLFPRILEKGRLYAAPVEGLWMDVGRPSDLLLANERMAQRRHGGSYRDPTARVAEGAKVPGSHLHAASEVARGATVEGSVLYDRAKVEAGAVVRRSILCEGAAVGAGAVVEDSVLGVDSRVPDKARIKDLKLPGGATAPG